MSMGPARGSPEYQMQVAQIVTSIGNAEPPFNRQEIDQMTGAGSLFDRIAGWAGKQTAGQPIPANILADMKSLSDLLAGNAKDQRSRGLQAVDKIYNSKFADEAPAAGPVLPKVGEIRNGYKYNGGDPSKQENWTKQ